MSLFPKKWSIPLSPHDANKKLCFNHNSRTNVPQSSTDPKTRSYLKFEAFWLSQCCYVQPHKRTEIMFGATKSHTSTF